MYDTSNDAWTFVAALNAARKYLALATVPGAEERILAIGGTCDGAEECPPETDKNVGRMIEELDVPGNKSEILDVTLILSFSGKVVPVFG